MNLISTFFGIVQMIVALLLIFQINIGAFPSFVSYLIAILLIISALLDILLE